MGNEHFKAKWGKVKINREKSKLKKIWSGKPGTGEVMTIAKGNCNLILRGSVDFQSIFTRSYSLPMVSNVQSVAVTPIPQSSLVFNPCSIKATPPPPNGLCNAQSIFTRANSPTIVSNVQCIFTRGHSPAMISNAQSIFTRGHSPPNGL
jgi:hypothetical protein